MKTQLHLAITNQFEAIHAMSEAVETFCQKAGMDQHSLMSLNLAMVEWVSNIIKYSTLSHGSHDIEVLVALRDDVIETTIRDAGVAFDPTDTPEPDLESDIKDRPIGGLGIYIIRNLVDTFQYTRQNGRNQIVMRKTLRSSEADKPTP